jgi:hypothetical protein
MRRLHDRVADAPLRIRMTSSVSAADFERVLAWRHHSRTPNFRQWLATSRPRLAPALQLNVQHVVRETGLVPGDHIFRVEGAFQAALQVDGWMVPMIARLNGQHPIAEVFNAARAAGQLRKGFTIDVFADLVALMIQRGFLEADLPE